MTKNSLLKPMKFFTFIAVIVVTMWGVNVLGTVVALKLTLLCYVLGTIGYLLARVMFVDQLRRMEAPEIDMPRKDLYAHPIIGKSAVCDVGFYVRLHNVIRKNKRYSLDFRIQVINDMVKYYQHYQAEKLIHRWLKL